MGFHTVQLAYEFYAVDYLYLDHVFGKALVDQCHRLVPMHFANQVVAADHLQFGLVVDFVGPREPAVPIVAFDLLLFLICLAPRQPRLIMAFPL